ncbi:hypothetical protein CH35J_011194 [Colletotrichum higginsianum]|uniref:Aspartate aminotransferase protein n=1 Tax=Colletotrichum higginsianum TaxID=80884 RepID=A0A4T0VHP6_9PEZI|nr:hypothetical protein CH35J_011194 [Colletotrichum higginsianum]
MAGPIQLGDVINFSKLAWDVYRFGWDNDFNATRQYSEFGRDVRGLAENLDILSRVVNKADQSLRQEGAFKPLRWDRSSLDDILGDYEETLTECFHLIENNHRYRLSSGPLRNIEWNVLVAPSADRLRARIALHNSKVLHVLKPFEIDLLCRVREDIRLVHQDLAQRINAVHLDLHRLIGVLVPDLEQALAQQAHRELVQLEIPATVAEGFQHSWTAERPEDGLDPGLREMADAFVLHYHRSTVNFTAGILVENRIPELEQYVSLLKCVWVMQRIRESPELHQSTTGLSHWPSYIQELEDDLGSQCDRFRHDLVAPSLIGLTPEMLGIWPEKELAQLVDVVTRDALMEQVLDIPLQGAAANVQRKLQLLRRMGADGKRFRINISGVEQGGTSKNSRRQAETIDFDITTVIINPLYAVPSNSGAWDMILRKDERVAKLAFMQLKDAVKFQQAVTGFKAFDNYSQYKAMVSFVVSGKGEPIVENACIQLWIPKQLDGQLVTNNESLVEKTNSTRSGSVLSSATSTASRQSTIRGPWDTANPFTTSPTDTVSMWNSMGSPTGSAARSPSISPPSAMNNPAGARSPMAIPRRPVGSGSRQTAASLPSGSRQATTSTSPTSPRSSSLFPGSWQSRAPSVSTTNTRADRTFSMSSNISTTTAPSNNSSSGSEARTATVSIGGHTTGTVHRRPPKPMLVLFTRNPQTGALTMVTVDIDEDTEVNPDRCNCRRSGRDGSSCQIAAIEQSRGKVEMSVRRFESHDGDVDWNLAKLALGRRGEREHAAAAWKDVRRISIMFPTAEDRAKFGGTPNNCQCSTRTEAELGQCLKKMHKGFLGLVRESGRQQLNEYHRTRFGSQHDVVRGMRDDYR